MLEELEGIKLWKALSPSKWINIYGPDQLKPSGKLFPNPHSSGEICENLAGALLAE